MSLNADLEDLITSAEMALRIESPMPIGLTSGVSPGSGMTFSIGTSLTADSQNFNGTKGMLWHM